MRLDFYTYRVRFGQVSGLYLVVIRQSKMTIWYHPEGFWCLYWAVLGSFVWLCQFSWKWQVKNVSLKMAIFPTQMLVQRLEMVIILKNTIENLSLAQKKAKNFQKRPFPESFFVIFWFFDKFQKHRILGCIAVMDIHFLPKTLKSIKFWAEGRP